MPQNREDTLKNHGAEALRYIKEFCFDVKALVISGCTSVHPYVSIEIASFAIASATFMARNQSSAIHGPKII
jgi:hypothetical protein